MKTWNNTLTLRKRQVSHFPVCVIAPPYPPNTPATKPVLNLSNEEDLQVANHVRDK